MGFPASPVNGQLSTVNNITYQWSSSSNTWTRTTTATGYVADYIQTWTNVNISSVGTNTDIVLNTQGSGTGIAYNTSTGVYTLTANKTYELYFAPHWSTFSDGTSGFLIYTWVDASSNTPIVGAASGNGLVVGVAEAINRNVNECDNNSLKIIYTPVTNQTVKLRVIGATGTALLRGDLASMATIRQLGASSLMSNVTIGGGAATTSTTTGAVIVNGGIGISGGANIGGAVRVGIGTFAKTQGAGDIALDNNSTDTPGVTFYYANNLNYGLDSFNPGSGQIFRITKQLNESGGAELVRVDSGGNLSGIGYGSFKSRVFSWTAAADGTPASSQQINGTIQGNASYTGTLDGVILTPASNSQTGSVSWNISSFDFTKDFVMEFTWFMGTGTNAADGLWVGVGGSTNFGNSQPGVANGSVMFRYVTYTNLYTKWWVNGTATGNQIAFHSGITYNGKWQTSRLMCRTVGSKRYAYMYTGDANNLDNAIDITSWSPGGGNVVVGAATGSVNSYQVCNHVSLEYI